jgi:putative ATP-dependent endonuclease of OLD family
MKLRHILFQNYRRIPDFEIEVRRHLVLVGASESGKSSVLRGLNTLLGLSAQQAAAGFTERDFTDPERSIVIEATLDQLSDEDKRPFPDEVSVGPPDELTVRLEARLDSQDNFVVVHRFFPDAHPPRGPSREQLQAIAWYSVPADRMLARELAGDRAGLVRSILTQLDLGADAALLAQKIDDLHVAVDAAGSLVDFKQSLASALTSALPRSVATQDLRVTPGGARADDPLAGASVGLAEHGTYASIAEQSDGVRSLAAFAIYGMVHDGANVVAIDEPEMHLHPAAQRALAASLALAEGQRVLATHSSGVVSQFDPSHVVVLGTSGKPRQLATSSRAAARGFALRWWRTRVVEPLTARALCIVEGVSDRLVLERVSLALGRDLDMAGVHVFELDGGDTFQTAYDLFGPDGFGLKIFGLADEDKRERWANAVGCAPAELEHRGFRVCSPDLEGLYLVSLGRARVAAILRDSGEFSAGELASFQQDAEAFLKRYKTRAALALAQGLTAADSGLLTPVADLAQLVVQQPTP